MHRNLLSIIFATVVPAFSTTGADVTFTRVTEGAIAEISGNYLGCAWGDYDGDGFVDLVVTGCITPNYLFHNEGDGTFSRVLTGAIAEETGGPVDGPSWADFENDGDLDLYVCDRSGTNRFYLNDGNGSFQRILPPPQSAGNWLANRYSALSPAWVDFDNDGLIDLFHTSNKHYDILYHHEEDGSMVRRPSPNNRNEHTWGTTWSDFDLDGDPDLFVAGVSMLFRNDGNGALAEVTPESSPGAPVGGGVLREWGVSTGDFDNDGDLDLAVASVAIARNRLYRNDLEAGWVELQDDVTYGVRAGSSSPLWGDYDNDGYLDLLITRIGEENLLYHNEGNGQFTRVTGNSITGDKGNALSGGWADFDNDGDLDVVLVDGTGQNWDTTNPKPLGLFRNDGGNSNNWILLKLEGSESNRSAIGAKVFLTASVSGIPMQQLREVTSSCGWQSQNDLRVHFGLGDAERVDTLRIEWPSGKVQILTDLAVNQIMDIAEAGPWPECEYVDTGRFLGWIYSLTDEWICCLGQYPCRLLTWAYVPSECAWMQCGWIYFTDLSGSGCSILNKTVPATGSGYWGELAVGDPKWAFVPQTSYDATYGWVYLLPSQD